MTKNDIRKIIDEARQGFVLVQFESRCYLPRRKDDAATLEAAKKNGVTPEDITVMKDTVADARITKIIQIRDRARKYHYMVTRPWAGRRVGVLRGQDLLGYCQEMNAMKKEFYSAVNDAAEIWPEIVADQAERLNGLFRLEDYPSQAEFKGRFDLGYYIDQLPVKGDWLLDIPEDAVEELAGSFEEQMQDRLDSLKKSVLSEASGVFKKVQASLKDKKRGKHKRITDALIKSVTETAGWLADLNIDNDQDINTILSTIAEHMPGAEDIRTSDDKLDTAIDTMSVAINSVAKVRSKS